MNGNSTKTIAQGDCFFDALRMGHPNKPSIASMRQYLSDNASEEMFNDQKIMYQNFADVIKSPDSSPEEKSNAKDLIRDYQDNIRCIISTFIN